MQNDENQRLRKRTPHKPNFYRIFMDSQPVWSSWKDLKNRKSCDKGRPRNKPKKRGRQDLVVSQPAPPWGWLGGTLEVVRGEPLDPSGDPLGPDLGPLTAIFLNSKAPGASKDGFYSIF